MDNTNPLSLALDHGSELASAVKSIQIACIFFAVWIGALGWDLFYYFIWDIELVFSSGWYSPVRALTRASYLLSRFLGFASLLLSLIFWVEGWSENFCNILPFVYEGILVLSYGFTLIILALRTLSLYPGSSAFERAVQCLTAIGIVVILSFGGVHVAEAGGHRMLETSTRCGYAEGALGLFLIRGMLVSTVVFNSIMFALTCYKIYTSGSQHFFNSNTIVGKFFNPHRASKNQQQPAGNQLAASLITQGLVAFFYLLVVDIVALVCCVVLTTNLYRQMTVICMAGFSSVLSAGLFRETYRAALSISATRQLEMRFMNAVEMREKIRYQHPYEHQNQNSSPRYEETEDMESFDERSQSRATERSVAHPNWNSDLEVSSVEHLAGTDVDSIGSRSSIDSKEYDYPETNPVSSFDQIPHLNHSSASTSNVQIDSNGPNEPHPFIPYSNPIQVSHSNQSSLMMGLSLHAFDDGASARSSNDTIGEVSILGSALPQWSSARRLDSNNRLERDAGQGQRLTNSGQSGNALEEMEMRRGPLPPPRNAARKTTSRYHHQA